MSTSAWRGLRAEREHAPAVDVVPARRGGHHLDRAAGEARQERPQAVGADEVEDDVGLGRDDLERAGPAGVVAPAAPDASSSRRWVISAPGRRCRRPGRSAARACSGRRSAQPRSAGVGQDGRRLVARRPRASLPRQDALAPGVGQAEEQDRHEQEHAHEPAQEQVAEDDRPQVDEDRPRCRRRRTAGRRCRTTGRTGPACRRRCRCRTRRAGPCACRRGCDGRSATRRRWSGTRTTRRRRRTRRRTRSRSTDPHVAGQGARTPRHRRRSRPAILARRAAGGGLRPFVDRVGPGPRRRDPRAIHARSTKAGPRSRSLDRDPGGAVPQPARRFASDARPGNRYGRSPTAGRANARARGVNRARHERRPGRTRPLPSLDPAANGRNGRSSNDLTQTRASAARGGTGRRSGTRRDAVRGAAG